MPDNDNITLREPTDKVPAAHPGRLLDEQMTADESRAEIERRLADPARRAPRSQELLDKEADELRQLQEIAHPGLVQKDVLRETEVLIDGVRSHTRAIPEDREWTADQGRAEIERRFGPDWQDRVRAAAETAIALSPAVYAAMEAEAAVGSNDPDIIEALDELRQRNERVPLIAALQTIDKQQLTVEQARARRFERMGDPDFRAKYDRGDPSAVAELEALAHWAMPPRAFRRLIARMQSQ